MLFMASQPFTASNTVTGSTRDTGDLDLGVQGLLYLEHGQIPTVAFAYQRLVRSGTAPNLDLGGLFQSATVLISGDLGDFHYDTNFGVTEQTSPKPSGITLHRAQYSQTLSVTRDLLPKLTDHKLEITGELWHFTQPLPSTDIHNLSVARANAAGALLALGYALSPYLVFDAAVDHGLTSTSTQWQAFTGVTYLLPHRLWPQHRGTPPSRPTNPHHIHVR